MWAVATPGGSVRELEIPRELYQPGTKRDEMSGDADCSYVALLASGSAREMVELVRL